MSDILRTFIFNEPPFAFTKSLFCDQTPSIFFVLATFRYSANSKRFARGRSSFMLILFGDERLKEANFTRAA